MLMRLRFKLSKTTNHFFFVSNLAEWHHSCRPEYNSAWIAQTGPLNSRERAALERFRRLIQQYGFGNKVSGRYLGVPFQTLSERDAWRATAEILTEEELLDLRAVFAIFKPRFEKAWQAAPRKSERIQPFAKFMSRKAGKTMLEDLRNIFVEQTSKIVSIVVLVSPLNQQATAAGGANVGPGHVSLELPDLKSGTWQFAYSVGILAHEIAHLLFEERGGVKIVERVVKKLRWPQKENLISLPVSRILNEGVIESFVPVGYLGQKYFREYLGPILLDNLDKGFIAAEKLMRGSTARY